jgi:hypothetical protein
MGWLLLMMRVWRCACECRQFVNFVKWREMDVRFWSNWHRSRASLTGIVHGRRLAFFKLSNLFMFFLQGPLQRMIVPVKRAAIRTELRLHVVMTPEPATTQLLAHSGLRLTAS